MLGLAHLDRPFDYLISAEQDGDAVPGVRVRVRFAGRLVDGFLLDRVAESDHPGKLGWLERVVSPECVLATNTSSLSITEMAADLEHPERVVGFHFFNPVAVLPLLEIVRGEQTDDATLATETLLSADLRGVPWWTLPSCCCAAMSCSVVIN